MTVMSSTTTSLPASGCCPTPQAQPTTDPVTGGVTGGGSTTTAPATTDLSTALQQLQEAVNQLQAAVTNLQSVIGGGAPANQATQGANNVGQVSPGQTTQEPPAAPAPTPTPTPQPAPTPPAAPTADPAAFSGAALTVKGQGVNDEQRENIRLVLEQGKEMGVNDKVLTAAVETIIVESTAHNYEGGDRDSVGLFQQRDSWGSFEERHTPKTAARLFYERAVNYDAKHPDKSIGQLAQGVQVSAFPDRYDEHEAEAKLAVESYKKSVGA